MTLEQSAEHILNIIATLLLFLSGTCATNAEYKSYPRLDSFINKFMGPLIIGLTTVISVIVFAFESHFISLGVVLIISTICTIILIHYCGISNLYFRKKLEIERAKPDYEAKQKALAAGFLLGGAFAAMLGAAFAFVHVSP